MIVKLFMVIRARQVCEAGSVCGHNEDVLHAVWECVTWILVSHSRSSYEIVYHVVRRRAQ